MEKKREETRLVMKEREERRVEAKRKEDTWALMKEAITYLKVNTEGWVERRSREVERIREEEKLDRLAVIKQKKKRYGKGKISKDESSKLKRRVRKRLGMQ